MIKMPKRSRDTTTITILISIIIIFLPFIANYFGGIIRGVSPFQYFRSVEIVIFIIFLNWLNIITGMMSFDHLSRRNIPFFTSLLPTISGSIVIFFFNFSIDLGGDPGLYNSCNHLPIFFNFIFSDSVDYHCYFQSKKTGGDRRTAVVTIHEIFFRLQLMKILVA